MGLFGLKGFFLSGDTYDVGVFTLFLFQMVFMDTAVTIPTGAMAERWKWSSFCLFALFMGAFVYPLFANWVWGGGWLATLGSNFGLGHGHVDFAGSSVVHMVGGVAAMAGAIVLGPRIGKFTASGTPVAIPGHDIPMAITGTFILAFGWFGFNPGSTLAGGDLRIGVVAVNTMMAGTAGALTAMCFVWSRFGKPDPGMMVNGMLAGLVAITAPCAFVNSVSAVIIGGIAGILVVAAVLFIERTLKIDDPVGAIAVHGVNGAWGVLSLGLFADGTYGDGWNGVPGTVKGLFYGDASQFAAQCVGTLTCIVWVFVDVLRVLQGARPHHRQPRVGGGRARGPGHGRDGRHGLPRFRSDAGTDGGRQLTGEGSGHRPHRSAGVPPSGRNLMIDRFTARQSLLKWNYFVSGGIFAAGLLMKVGAPMLAVVTGIGFAAVANLIGRSRLQTAGSSQARASMAVPPAR